MRDTFAALSLTVLLGAAASAQSTQSIASSIPQALASTLTSQTLADLPLGENVFAALETTQPELIADRFNNAGLNTGERTRVGGFLGSWSQTLFRVGDVNVTDPAGSGAPLLFPELLFWQQIDVANGLMPIDFDAVGLATTLQPRRPAVQWTTAAGALGSGGTLVASAPDGQAPPVTRLQDWRHVGALVSGPLVRDRLGIVAAGTFAGGSKFLREVSPVAESTLGSGFVHLVFTPSAQVESRILGWVQRAHVPFERRNLFQPAATTRDWSTHLQSTWERRAPTGLAWRLFGGVTMRSRMNDVGSISLVTADRLVDGPISAIASSTADGTSTRWAGGTRVTTNADHGLLQHLKEIGGDVDYAAVGSSDRFAGIIGERVDGMPARVWAFSHPDMPSRRHATSLAAFVGDHIALSRTATLDAAVRLESITGRATGAATGVNWLSLLPRAVVSWKFTGSNRWEFIAGYRRSASQLNLDYLAFGDPAAETALVSRWLGPTPASPASLAVIVDRVGPGTGGNPGFSRVDPNLKRPTTNEFVVGIGSLRGGWLRLGLTGIARRETNLIGVVDVGVPITSYSTIGIPDPGHDFFSSDDDQVLIAYSRAPSSFGRNQYLLTNPGQQTAAAYALKLTAEGSTERLFLLFGATASAGTGSAGNRGYLPVENDQDLAGELFTNPNAATYARGRLFGDRAFTIKWTTVYRFPGDLRVGAIARYQDGQPFARLVPASGLTQGPELIRAYANGGNRFTFTGTLDIRVQKGFKVGNGHIDGLIDFYNLATRSNEVEEYTVTGPNFRTPTAIEPPRSIHLGARVTF